MSRPCFALSVMLCCMAGPLLIIGNAHARDTVVSPSHGPGECIVCPLAHGPLEACGGYSDYDYNNYWYDDYSPPPAGATPPAADPELEAAQSPSDVATEEAWESDYEDYYADYGYGYGDDTASTEAEDLTLDETPAPAEMIEPAAESAATSDVPQGEEQSERYDEYGWHMDDTDASGDYCHSYDNYEPFESAEPDTVSTDEAIAADADIDYEAYEEEWFSYGAETTLEATQASPETDEAYEALSESANEAYCEEMIDSQAAEVQRGDESWGDEEDWYCEEAYGCYRTIDEETEQVSTDVEPAAPLETGYDEAYDSAMASDPDAAETVANLGPANPVVEPPGADCYESFYDDCDYMYDFESASAGCFAAETIDMPPKPAVEEQVQQAMDGEPAWLTELVDRMLARIWTNADSMASLLARDSPTAMYADECAPDWDCELGYWAPAQAEPPSVVLATADTLDRMAALLQNAADVLRGAGDERLAETAEASTGESPR